MSQIQIYNFSAIFVVKKYTLFIFIHIFYSYTHYNIDKYLHNITIKSVNLRYSISFFLLLGCLFDTRPNYIGRQR